MRPPLYHQNRQVRKRMCEHLSMHAQILKKLIRFDTANPPGNEYALINYVKTFLDTHDITYKIFSADKKRPNIVASIGKGRPSLLISCHADTVPAGEGWHTNPLEGVEKNGNMYGRGAVDDKGPLAATLVALTKLKKEDLRGTLLVGVFSDEEKGSKLGLQHVITKIPLPDYALMPDIGQHMRTISIGEKGLLQVELHSKGKAAHGSTPHKGSNAIVHLMHALQDIENHAFPFTPHSLFSKPSMNIGLITGGTAPNMVPSSAKATIDFRFLPGTTDEDIMNHLQKLLKKHANVTATKLVSKPPTLVTKNNPLVNAIVTATKKIIGISPVIKGESGATDAKTLVQKGVLAVGFSCGSAEEMHVPDEHISIKELEQFSEVLVEIVTRLLS